MSEEIPYYRFVTYTRYSDESVRAVREDEFHGLPEDWSDYIWQFARTHREARDAHYQRLDERQVLLNAGFSDRHTY